MKEKRPYAEGLRVAYKLVALLGPFCERIEIAGSLRRRTPEVGDVELVAIPKMRSAPGLFEAVVQKETWLDICLEAKPSLYQMKKSGKRMKQFRFEGFQVDLFVTTPEQWGVIFTLRTGSADFSKWLVTSRAEGGARALNKFVENGRVWAIGRVDPLSTPEETEVFRVLDVPWVPPELRYKGYWGADMQIWRPVTNEKWPINHPMPAADPPLTQLEYRRMMEGRFYSGQEDEHVR